MSKTARLFVSSLFSLALITILATHAIAQTPLQPNSIQVSRVQYDGNNGNTYTSPYLFPEIFNDQAGCNTTNDICNTAGIQGSIWIDYFNSVPAASTQGTSLSLPSSGTAVTTFPTPEPGSYITTSFSSKSEGALMLSLNGQYLTYIGYQAGDQLDDVSNSYSLEPEDELFPNTYTLDASLGTPITITSASESGTTATITLSSAVNVPEGAFFTIANMGASYAGYDGTWSTASSSATSTITLTGLTSGLNTCSTQSDCGGTATYDLPYPFYDREVALIDATGTVTLTPIDDEDSGDNPRASLSVDGNEFYTAGNSDSTESPVTVNGVTYDEPGLTIGVRCAIPEQSQSYQLGTYTAADRPDESSKKHVKDNNWRGIGIYTDGNGNQQLYVSKGSGSNGDDGLFQVGSPLPSCTLNGTDTKNTITELWGAQATVPGGQSYQTSPYLPFGFWIVNPTTMYVADEGNAPTFTGGSSPSFQNSTNGTFTLPQLANGSFANDPYAGLEKWSLVNGTWQYDYTIQAGLNLYQPVTVNGYTDVNGDAIQSYTYGIRNMTGYNNGDGTATIYAITSQFSAVSGGEPDPTSLVGVTDQISATTLPVNEQFVTIQTSAPGEVFRGVAYVPPQAGFTRQTQTITFPPVGPLTYGTGPVTLSATATSGWPVAFTVISGPASVSGNSLTINGAGSIVVEADQSGNTDYSAAASVQQTIVVNQASTSINVISVSPASEIYGTDSPVTITAELTWSGSGVAPTAANITIGGNGPSSYSGTSCGSPVSNSITCTATYMPTAADGAGPYTEAATFSGDSNYLTSSSPQANNFTITQASQTITFTTNPPASAVWNTQFAVAATGGASGNAVTFSSSGSCSGSGSGSATYTMTSGTGKCSVIANQAGNNNYSAAPQVTKSVAAKLATQTITATPPAEADENDSFTVSASVSSGLTLTYASSGDCTNSGPTYTMGSSAGTCAGTIIQSGNNDYAPTSYTWSTTVITKLAKPAVSLSGAPATAVGGSSFTVTATYPNTQGVPEEVPTIATTGSCIAGAVTGSGTSYQATITMTKGTGKCSITAAWAANFYYAAATAKQSTEATIITPTVSFTGAPTTATDGTQFTVTATSNESGSDASTPNITASGACTASGFTDLGGGSYQATITISRGSGTCSMTAKWVTTPEYEGETLKQVTTAD